MTKRQFDKLSTIIGKIEALQAEVAGRAGDKMGEAKRLLIKAQFIND